MPTKTVSYQEVVDVVMTLPVDRLASVYDFARFVRAQALDSGRPTDIFGETEDQIRSDTEQWDQEFAASREQLRLMAREAAAEYRAERTTPMTFTEEGRLAR